MAFPQVVALLIMKLPEVWGMNRHLCHGGRTSNYAAVM
jgi:hypothetical protein